MLEERQGAGRDILDLPDTLYDTDGPDADFDIGPQQSWLRRRWPVLLGIALIIILLAAFILPKVLRPKTTPVTYTTALVRQGTLAVTVSATGPVTAPTYDANFSEQGTIYSIHVKVGQHVNAGDVLGKILQTDGVTIDELDAPHAGTVAVINGNVDGTPGNGTGASAFVELVDLNQLQVEADVNEVDIGSVKPGQLVNFTVSAFSTRVFTGRVATISPAGTSSSNVVTYPVVINVNASSLNGVQLLPSMTANVTITTATSAQGALLVPASAVTFARSSTVVSAAARRQGLLQAFQLSQQSGGTTSGTTASTTRTAAIVLEQVQGKWVVKPVVLGLTNGTNYVVLSGLTQGESVVTGQSGGTTSTTTTTGTGAGGLGTGGFGGGGFGGGGFGGGTGTGRGGTGTGTGTGTGSGR